MPTNGTLDEKKGFSLSNKVFFFAMIEAPLIYLVILYLLQRAAEVNGMTPGDQHPLPLITLLLLVLCLVMVASLYKYLIPRFLEPEKRIAKKMDDIFGKAILVLAWGAEVPAIFGVLIGMLEYTSIGTISWILELPFILFGFMHGIVLYKYQILTPPTR